MVVENAVASMHISAVNADRRTTTLFSTRCQLQVEERKGDDSRAQGKERVEKQ